MSDHPFDIDDILNEINKRKEEIEQEINSVSVDAEEVQKKVEEITEEVIAEASAEETQTAEISTEETSAEEESATEEILDEEETPTEEKASAEEKTPVEEEANAEEDITNIFDFVEDVPENSEANNTETMRKSKKDKKWRKTKKGKILTAVIIILVIVLAGAGIFGFYYINGILDYMSNNEEKTEGSKLEEWTGMDQLIVKFDDIYEETDVYSYRDMIKAWYYNGEPASSTNILNILLIGEDTRGDEIKDEDTLADSVIIGSVNTETGELVLSSILRDTYAYYELVPGDESTGTFGKINEAMSKGDLAAYINAVERMFKINIDNYVLVNFSNFKKIIDTLGGVTVDITAKEIREINNNPKRYGNVYIEGDAGTKRLTGEQALAYCRIRYIDGDDVRADRQKTVLLSLFSEIKGASPVKLTSVATNLLPYVKTGFSKSELFSLGEYALTKGWISYKIVTHTVPKNETRADGTPITTCVGGKGANFYNTWCWKVDFPLAAQVLQEKIYGQTNIILAEDRPNFKNLSAY